jgi:hypothetical protein
LAALGAFTALGAASTTGAGTGAAAAFLATALGADLVAGAFIIPETEEEEEDILRGLCSQNKGCRDSILF